MEPSIKLAPSIPYYIYGNRYGYGMNSSDHGFSMLDMKCNRVVGQSLSEVIVVGIKSSNLYFTGMIQFMPIKTFNVQQRKF